MKVSKLLVEYDYDFGLIGLITSLKPHKLAWHLNKELKASFIREEEINFDFLNEAQLVIINYLHQTEYSNWRLIKNKSCEFVNIASPYLIPELKEYDYFVQLRDENDIFGTPYILERLKNIVGIEYSKELSIEKLKSKDNLIF